MKKSLVLLLVFTMVFSFAFAGCGASDEPTEPATENNEDVTDDANEDATDDTNEETQEDAVDNPALERGNVFTVATESVSGKFNPVLSSEVYDSWVVSLVFDGLTSNNPKGEVVTEGVAKSWEVSEDKMTYTFHLKEGIKFHDGEELTAEDVAFTFETIAHPDYDGPRGSAVNDIVGAEAYRNGEADSVEGIKVIDEYTISFTINEPNVKKIRDFGYGIMPKHYYAFDTFEDFKLKLREPMGSGIMKFKNFEVGQYIEFEKNPDYFKGAAKIDGVVIKMIPNETQPAAVAAGQVDLANPSSNLENYETMINTGIANVQEFLGNSYRYVGFNHRLDKFKDKRTRQALWYGLNMAEYIDAQWEGFAQPCYSPISPISWAAPDADTLNKYEFNPEKAKELLAEAGWEDSNGNGTLDQDFNGNGTIEEEEEFVIEWTTYKESDWPLNLIAVAEKNWGDLGIEVNSNVMEFGAVSEQVYQNQDFEIYNMGWSLAIDPDPTSIFHSKSAKLGGYNSVGFANDRADEIFEQGLKEYDSAKRAALYAEWAQIANEELPYMFVSIGTRIWGVNQRVSGLNLGPYYDWTSNIDTVELEY